MKSQNTLVEYKIFNAIVNIPKKAFVENSSKTLNYIEQIIEPSQAIDGKGYVPQIIPSQQQKLKLKDPIIIKDSQKLEDLQDDFDKLYRGFFDQINLLIKSGIEDPLSTELLCPKVIKNGDKYEVIAESKNIAEAIRDSKLLKKSNYEEILKKFSNNREIALAVVKQCGSALRYASKELSNYKDLALWSRFGLCKRKFKERYRCSS